MSHNLYGERRATASRFEASKAQVLRAIDLANQSTAARGGLRQQVPLLSDEQFELLLCGAMGEFERVQLFVAGIDHGWKQAC